MIIFNFKDKQLFEECHDALVGSPAYKESEIAIVEDRELSLNGFQLVVGNENKQNLIINM